MSSIESGKWERKRLLNACRAGEFALMTRNAETFVLSPDSWTGDVVRSASIPERVRV